MMTPTFSKETASPYSVWYFLTPTLSGLVGVGFGCLIGHGLGWI